MKQERKNIIHESWRTVNGKDGGKGHDAETQSLFHGHIVKQP